jgi:hypothetical protein
MLTRMNSGYLSKDTGAVLNDMAGKAKAIGEML